MGKLSSALVQRKLASLRDVEEALARQVLYGGDLATNLLEQAAAVDERALVDLLAEVHGLPPTTAGRIPSSPAEARLLVPGDVAAMRRGTSPDRIEREGDEFAADVDRAYRQIAEIFAQRVVVLDGTAKADAIAEEIHGHVRDLP